MSKINTMVIHSDDRLHLSGPLHAQLLIVHLGLPGPRVELGAHELTYDEMELHGVGDLTMLRAGVEVSTISKSSPYPRQERFRGGIS